MSRSKKDAEHAGVKVCDTKHQMKRRSPWHDYRDKGTYMLTLVVEGRRPLLGRLVMEPGEEPPGTGASKTGTGASRTGTGASRTGTGAQPLGTEASKTGVKARVELSELGKAIVDEEVKKITEHYRMVEVWKLCMMPDHIHMIVRVTERMPEGKNLGQVVWGFKVGCTKAWWRIGPGEKPPGTEAQATGMGASKPGTEAQATGMGASKTGMEASVPAGCSAGERSSLFEEGYNDKILLREGQLDNWKHYLDDNPRRLAVKKLHPDLFKIVDNAVLVDHNGDDEKFAEFTCQMVGNRFLFDIPQKVAVIVHGGYSDSEFEEYRSQWLACGEAGGVLISAAIATREKTVMREAMDRGYSIILLRENGFPPLYKPAGESFYACTEGRLLQISPWEYHMERKTISREQCLKLNRLAERIADGSVTIK